MSLSDSSSPRNFGTPGGRMGDGLEKEILADAEHDRAAHDVERIHEEAVERGEAAPAKKPWWRFWG